MEPLKHWNIIMSKSIFRQIMDGDLPMPKAAATLGATIKDVKPDAGTIVVEFEAIEAFTNPIGNVQGGFLAAMLDDTMGPALTATLDEGEFAPTLELKVNFIAPAKVGPLVGYGRVVARGGSVCFLEGDLHQEGKLVAKAICYGSGQADEIAGVDRRSSMATGVSAYPCPIRSGCRLTKDGIVVP
jgi:uncharacterized protein (TIGR00369 family)